MKIAGENGLVSLLRLSQIGKSFAGITVLQEISFTVEPGEVHVLAGENGAGKSTLIKIISGVYPEYDGELEYLGKATRFRSPSEASARGISVIHQELSLIDSMTVFDNLFLGREFGSRASRLKRANELCKLLGLEIDLDRPVEEFSISVKNLIEIAKAFLQDSKIVVMDEPTSALGQAEVLKLFELIKGLKTKGCGIIYISHKMDEIYQIADRISVLRDGRLVGTEPARDLPEGRLISMMIGRELNAQFPPKPSQNSEGTVCLNVSGLHVADAHRPDRWAVENLDFNVRAGEVLGIAGLQGSGSSEIFSGIFGSAISKVSGRVELNGELFLDRSPRQAISRGIAYLTNDRKGSGLVLGLPIEQNISMASLATGLGFSKYGWIDRAQESTVANQQMKALGIRARSKDQETGTLSGGNQQKVVLAKWLETKPKVLLLDEPTRGVDVGAKQEIYQLIRRLTADGIATVMISTEMPELLGLSDRILVMHRGKKTAEFDRESATQEKILTAAMGVGQSASRGNA